MMMAIYRLFRPFYIFRYLLARINPRLYIFFEGYCLIQEGVGTSLFPPGTMEEEVREFMKGKKAGHLYIEIIPQGVLVVDVRKVVEEAMKRAGR